MLKIKDNVDLKELEKFGFNKNISLTNEPYFEFEIEICCGTYSSCTISTETKEVSFCSSDIDGETVQITPDILYDLIQAGLVEKVED